mgnify:CR=1 FL=1
MAQSTPLAEYQCLTCGKKLQTLEVKNHQAACQKPKQTTGNQRGTKTQTTVDVDVLCGVCQRYVHPKHIDENVKKYHPHKKFFPAKSSQEQAAFRKPENRREKYTGASSTHTGRLDDDGIDGGKYTGILHWDTDGTFGSFPLHDDYSEDVEA